MKVDDLLDEFDFLCKEEKRDFLLKLWENFYDEFMEDFLAREIILRMYNDLRKSGTIPLLTEDLFKNKIGKE